MTTALEEVRGQCHAPAALYPRERPGTRCTGGWVTQLYKSTVDRRKLLPNVSASHNITNVPNTNLCEPAHFKFQNSK